MRAELGRLIRSEKVNFVILLVVLMILIAFLRPVLSVCVAFADALDRMPIANRTGATLLAIVGFSLSYWSLMKWRQNPVRQALKSYILAAVGMAGPTISIDLICRIEVAESCQSQYIYLAI